LKVLDYGISKRLAQVNDDESHSLTERHSLLGSPAYMSPEQLRESKDVDARADIWSVGVLLYELLTGSRPFKANRLSALSMSIAADAPPPPSSINAAVPAALDRTVMRCLKKDPCARFGCVAELAAALRERAAPRREHKRLRVAIAIGCLGLGGAASRWVSPEPGPELSRQEAAMLPVPLPPVRAAAPRLNVYCDLPLAAGNVRFASLPGIIGVQADRTWPLTELCESSGEARSELGFELTRLLPLSRVVLEPAHPFYDVELQTASSELTLSVRRKQRASVQFVFDGARCERIESVDVNVEGLPPNMLRLGWKRASKLGAACTHRMDLPFEAFGKMLELRLRPTELSARAVRFESTVLHLAVERRPSQHPAAPARATPCIPPRYCRG
jgi:hypothetical protein